MRQIASYTEAAQFLYHELRAQNTEIVRNRSNWNISSPARINATFNAEHLVFAINRLLRDLSGEDEVPMSALQYVKPVESREAVQTISTSLMDGVMYRSEPPVSTSLADWDTAHPTHPDNPTGITPEDFNREFLTNLDRAVAARRISAVPWQPVVYQPSVEETVRPLDTSESQEEAGDHTELLAAIDRAIAASGPQLMSRTTFPVIDSAAPLPPVRLTGGEEGLGGNARLTGEETVRAPDTFGWTMDRLFTGGTAE